MFSQELYCRSEQPTAYFLEQFYETKSCFVCGLYFQICEVSVAKVCQVSSENIPFLRFCIFSSSPWPLKLFFFFHFLRQHQDVG